MSESLVIIQFNDDQLACLVSVPHILEMAKVLMRSHSVTICDSWAKTFQRTVSSLPTSKMTLGNVNFREIPTHYDDDDVDDVGVDDDVHDDVDVDDLGQHPLPGKSAPPAHTRTQAVDQLLRVCITLQSLHDYIIRGMALHIVILPGGCVTWRGRFQEALAIAGRHFSQP